MNTFFRSKDSLEKFCGILKTQVQKLIDIEHKKMIPLTLGDCESSKCQNMFSIYREKNYYKSRNLRTLKDKFSFTGKY